MFDGTKEGLIISERGFHYDAIDAVSPDYIEACTLVLEKSPKDLISLERLARGDLRIAPPDDMLARTDRFVDFYLASSIKGKEDNKPPLLNPFDLFVPYGLRSIYDFLSERGLSHEYQSRYSINSNKEKRDFSFGPFNTRMHEDEFIRLIYGWNSFYIGFLLSLNVVDASERVSKLDEMGRRLFEKSSPHGTVRSLLEISPYDNYPQWLVYNALNILHHPETRIAPLARYRAIETLAQFDIDELKVAFLGQQDTGYSSRGRNSPILNYTIEFGKELFRLPRRFWTQYEKTNDLHEKWEENPSIQEIFDTVGIPGWKRTYDYGRIFNNLVELYPREAVHITLLMLFKGYQHSRPAFEALISYIRLDPIARQKLFGHGATYLSLHQLSRGTMGKIEDSLGINPFDDDTLPSLDGLSLDDIRQVASRQARTIIELQVQLALAHRKAADTYFSGVKREVVDRVDPKGYWRLLGVHPETNPSDLETVLRGAFAALARKYHSDTSDSPDDSMMARVAEAYQVLSDSEKRNEYMAGR